MKAILCTIATKSVRLATKKVAQHPPQTLEDWNAVAKCNDQLPGQYRYSIYYKDGKLSPPHEVFARSKYPDTLTIYVPSASYLIDQKSAAEKEFLQSRNPTQVTNFIDNISGSGFSTNNIPLRNLVEKYICVDLKEEIAARLPGENLIEYLKRRGQRCSNAVELTHHNRTVSHIRNIEKDEDRKAFESTLEREKWETTPSACNISEPNSCNKTLEVELEPDNSVAVALENVQVNSLTIKKRKRHPLEARGLGRFCRVQLTFTGRRKGHVTCTCEMFRRQRTCDESKMFGLVFFDMFPPVQCMGHICKGWDKIGYKIGDLLKRESYCGESFHTYIANGAPLEDPWLSESA